MSWTFNPPPGWPAQPEGWQPPPGWSPDPSWPPPPADWQFWVQVSEAPTGPDSPAPQHTPAEPSPPAATGRPWLQHWYAAAGAALAVLLVGCLGGAAVALVTSPDEPAAAPGPEPTTSPAPQSTTPAPAPTGSGLTVGQQRDGEGPAIVELDLPDGAVRTITITFSGTESYQMSLVDEEGEVVLFLATGSGDYTGTHLLGEGFSSSETPAALDIVEATGGSWTVRMQDIAEAPTWPQQSSGTGYGVLRIDPNAVAEPTPVTGTHDGESNFIVWAYADSEFGDVLLFNEIGEFSGAAQSDLGGNVTIMEIQADGAWTVNPG